MKDNFNRNVYRYLLALTAIMLAGGTIFYHFTEKLSWVNAYYFSVITLATVGYGDIVPKTDVGKLFTTFYVFVGVGIIGTFISYNLRRRAEKIATKHHGKKEH